MLIRVGGGLKGIAQYLKTGQKKGRNKTRDELDERLVLLGDLDAMNEAITALAKRGEKYLHVTLSFGEDFIDAGVLREITQEFQRFIKAAFRDDELMCYAEAHVPRIKSLAMEGTESKVDRFVHIHFIIPKLNLLTHGTADPLGRVSRQIPYLNAFQERMNAIYGLTSPKENRRTEFETGSTIVARHHETRDDQDEFSGPNRDLKGQILKAILEKDISSSSELKRYLETLGEVKVRNAGQFDAYFNCKPLGNAKGVNLKEVMFSDDFLCLSPEAKASRLKAAPRAHQFLVAGKPQPVDATHERLLEEWYQMRSKEVKYLDSGRKAEWSAYGSMNREKKMDYIKGLEQKHYCSAIAEQSIPMDELSFIAAEPKAQVPVAPEFLTASDTTLGQRIKDIVAGHLDRIYHARLTKTPVTNSFDPVANFLETKYQVPTGKFATPLAEACGGGTLGVYGFLRRSMNLEPSTSWVNLVKLKLVESNGHFAGAENSVSDLLGEEFKRRQKKVQENEKMEEAEKRQELAVLQMSLVLSRKFLWAQYQLQQDQERLKMVATKTTSQFQAMNFISSPEASPKAYKPETLFQVGEWNYRMNSAGHVEFTRKEVPVIRDEDTRVVVAQSESQVVEMALRLAVVKFGPKLTLYGSDQFKASAIEVASRLKVRIEFTNPELHGQLELARDRQKGGWGD